MEGESGKASKYLKSICSSKEVSEPTSGLRTAAPRVKKGYGVLPIAACDFVAGAAFGDVRGRCRRVCFGRRCGPLLGCSLAVCGVEVVLGVAISWHCARMLSRDARGQGKGKEAR